MEGVNKRSAKKAINLYRSLSNDRCLKITELLEAEGQLSVTEIMEKTGMVQSNVSALLGDLYENGLVQREKQGKTVHYKINQQKVIQIGESLRVLLAACA